MHHHHHSMLKHGIDVVIREHIEHFLLFLPFVWLRDFKSCSAYDILPRFFLSFFDFVFFSERIFYFKNRGICFKNKRIIQQ